MHEIGWDKYNAVTVGEGVHKEGSNPLDFVGRDRKEINMMLIFDLFEVGKLPKQNKIVPWTLTDLKRAQGKNQYLIEEGWATTFLENHDSARCISQFGDESRWAESGKLFCVS
jgi:glycosidase